VRITYDYDEQMYALKITEPRGRYVETHSDLQRKM
jgi:hypothetical protein